MRSPEASDFEDKLSIIKTNHPKQKKYIENCENVWINSEIIHEWVIAKIELIGIIWKNRRLKKIYKDLEESWYTTIMILKIMKAHIRLREIIKAPGVPSIFWSKRITNIILRDSLWNSPKILGMVENHLEKLNKAA